MPSPFETSAPSIYARAMRLFHKIMKARSLSKSAAGRPIKPKSGDGRNGLAIFSGGQGISPEKYLRCAICGPNGQRKRRQMVMGRSRRRKTGILRGFAAGGSHQGSAARRLGGPPFAQAVSWPCPDETTARAPRPHRLPSGSGNLRAPLFPRRTNREHREVGGALCQGQSPIECAGEKLHLHCECIYRAAPFPGEPFLPHKTANFALSSCANRQIRAKKWNELHNVTKIVAIFF